MHSSHRPPPTDQLPQFLVMVPDTSKNVPGSGLDSGLWLDRPAPVARAYLRGWFGLDFLSIFVSTFDIIEAVRVT